MSRWTDAALMGMIEGAAALHDDFQRVVRVERTFAVAVFVQVNAVDELHGEERGVIGLAEFVEGDDVFVAELGGVLGLAAKALDHRRFGGHLRRQHLQGDIAASLCRRCRPLPSRRSRCATEPHTCRSGCSGAAPWQRDRRT